MWRNEPSHSQINFHCENRSLNGLLNFSECKSRGQNPSVWKDFYIIEKVLKRRCLQWACMSHLDIWSTNYDQKKGQESNWRFEYWSLKVRNRPNFWACRQRAIYSWKALDQGYNFASDLIKIESLHLKLCAPKIVRVLTVGISRLALGSPETKCHLDVALWRTAENTIRGKVVASPSPGRDESCESEVARGLF
jgi:hypothetical protein